MTLHRILIALTVLLSFPSLARAVDADYTLNPGDVLQVTVWKEDGLDQETLVLPDGTINFPLAGTIKAAGLTPGALQQKIKAALASDIPDATVNVSVKAALGNVVDVIGQVTKPGELVLSHHTTVMQALSMAGGLTPYASRSRIVVLRHESGKDVSIAFPYDDVSRGRSLESDVVLSPGDVVVVPDASLF